MDFTLPRYKFFKVSYDKQKMERDCRRIISEAITKTMPLFHFNNPNNFFINLQELLQEIYLVYKNDAFKHENEWRIVVNGGITTQTYDGMLFTIGLDNPEVPIKSNIGSIGFSKLQHCVINKQLRSYIDLYFESEKNNFIKEIWLGPKCQSKEEDIFILLGACGYDVERMYKNGFRVNTSRASYR